MTLMSRTTGLNINYKEHVKQSVMDILTTLPGERVYLNQYGGSLRDMLDQPLDGSLLARARNRILQTLYDYEPRIDISRIDIIPDSTASKFEVVIEAFLKERNENIIIDGIVI